MENQQALDALHIITAEESEELKAYFESEQDEVIPDIKGMTAADAARLIGPEDFEEETLQHILFVLFPEKYEGDY